MGEKIEIKTVELVRRIRDQHAEAMIGKSNKEIIEYYCKAAEAFKKRGTTIDSRTSSRRKGAAPTNSLEVSDCDRA